MHVFLTGVEELFDSLIAASLGHFLIPLDGGRPQVCRTKPLLELRRMQASACRAALSPNEVEGELR